MSKLWKQEWKYHIFFVAAVTVILIISCDLRGNLRFLGEWSQVVGESLLYDDGDGKLAFWRYVVDSVECMCCDVNLAFTSKIIWIVFGGLLIKKGMIYWVEKNACGREFFQSLPIRRNERMLFHLLMDVMTVIVSVVGYTFYEYSLIDSGLERYGVELPWLNTAYIGLVLVCVSYILMVLGWLYVVECIWVSGTMKIFGFCGSLLMIFVVLSNMFQRFDESKVAQSIYGFFSRASVAGNYYSLDDPNPSSVGFRYEWVHDCLEIPMIYKGEVINVETMLQYQGELYGRASELDRLYDFTHPSTYMYHVIGYLLIGIVLFVIAYKLSSKQELSKGVFYFDFGRYLFSGMMAATFYALIMEAQIYAWQGVVNIAATIIVFVVLMYLLDEDRKPLWKRKEA